MSLQQSINFFDSTTTTHTVVASGGVILNAVSVIFGCTTLTAGTGLTLSIQDSASSLILWQIGIVPEAVGVTPISVFNLSIPSGVNGGLRVVASLAAAGYYIDSTTVYTVP